MYTLIINDKVIGKLTIGLHAGCETWSGEPIYKTNPRLGQGQNHLAVAGGYAVGSNVKMLRSTHPLPRGGSDPIQVRLDAKISKEEQLRAIRLGWGSILSSLNHTNANNPVVLQHLTQFWFEKSAQPVDKQSRFGSRQHRQLQRPLQVAFEEVGVLSLVARRAWSS